VPFMPALHQRERPIEQIAQMRQNLCRAPSTSRGVKSSKRSRRISQRFGATIGQGCDRVPQEFNFLIRVHGHDISRRPNGGFLCAHPGEASTSSLGQRVTQGQTDGEDGASAERAADVDMATMFFDNTARQ
jgi:hypothetical protein